MGSSLTCLSGAGSSVLHGTKLGSGAVPGVLCPVVYVGMSSHWHSGASHVVSRAEWLSCHTAAFELMLLTCLKLLLAVDSWNRCGFSFANRKFFEMVLAYRDLPSLVLMSPVPLTSLSFCAPGQPVWCSSCWKFVCSPWKWLRTSKQHTVFLSEFKDNLKKNQPGLLFFRAALIFAACCWVCCEV